MTPEQKQLLADWKDQLPGFYFTSQFYDKEAAREDWWILALEDLINDVILAEHDRAREWGKNELLKKLKKISIIDFIKFKYFNHELHSSV